MNNKCSEQSSYFLKVDECHLIQMEISWWTRPGLHELRYLTPLWGDSGCRSLPRMDERASAKLTTEQAKTTATRLCPTRSPPRPREQANEERSWSRWALEQDWNIHKILFISSNNLRCGLIQSRQSSWGLLLSCLPLQQTPKSSEAHKHLSWHSNWRFNMFFTAGTFTSVTVLTPAMQRSSLSLKTSSHWRFFSEQQSLVHIY